MQIALPRSYLELIIWRDEEIKSGNMTKARQIQHVIRKKKIQKTK